MVRQLKEESQQSGKSFIHLNAGGMLGGNIWFPILGSGPAAESVAKLNFTAIVSVNTIFKMKIGLTHFLYENRQLDIGILMKVFLLQSNTCAN